MRSRRAISIRLLLVFAATAMLAGCWTDAATRLAYDIDASAGKTVSSHRTSCHARHVDTPQTGIVKKPARATLSVALERRGGRAVIADVR